MPNATHCFTALLISTLALACAQSSTGEAPPSSRGNYTTDFPGVDKAGRNAFPPGVPQTSGSAADTPVPTNDWWSSLIMKNHADNMFNYPLAMRTTAEGLVMTYIPWGPQGDSTPIVVGVSGLNADRATVADHSDWTVTIDWTSDEHRLQATSGIGMPFVYFEKADDDLAQVRINSGDVTVSDEMILVENAAFGADFAIYAPAGSAWQQDGSTYTSTLNGKNYWSAAMLPQDTPDPAEVARAYQQYAYVFPTGTTASWSYDSKTSVVRTEFDIAVEVKEGEHEQVLQGLLPHQWNNLASNSPVPEGHAYASVRGELRTLEGNHFAVENVFKGILPTLPLPADADQGFSRELLQSKIAVIENDALSDWTDSYNEGQVMNRLIQTARLADQTGDLEARDKMIATIQERLEDWLTYEAGEIAFLFYYNRDWSALIGYPAGHGQDANLNDHHFHWGYFIHAAAFLEQFEPGWAAAWGDMVNHLVRDAAGDDREDQMFPFLRNFSPYAGHCWANGFATFPQGNDQESTSESMQFNSSLIHWGTVTGNDRIRDLGIYLYTTEQTAIEEYWLDIHERNFKTDQPYSLVSRVWGNSYDNGTFWTNDIAASYGIEMYPIHGGSLYLGHPKAYAEKLWAEIETNTNILEPGDKNPNLWHDTFWKFLSFTDPAKAIELYEADPDRALKFGVSDAQTYHWLHAMKALGTVETRITADYPIAAVFKREGVKTYVAHNYSAQAITVRFSDGVELKVPAKQMATFTKHAAIQP